MTDRLNGSALTKLRRAWAPKIAAGQVKCWVCNQVIQPDQPWDLGHITDYVLGGHRLDLHPEHRHRRHCAPDGGNRSRGATLGNQLRRSRRARRRLEAWTR